MEESSTEVMFNMMRTVGHKALLMTQPQHQKEQQQLRQDPRVDGMCLG